MTPNRDKLPSLRKGRRKRKVPAVFDGMCGKMPKRGRFAFRSAGDDFQAEWLVCDSKSAEQHKKALFSELCLSPHLELERLELGWLIADIAKHEANAAMRSIPGPNEAMKEADRFGRIEDEWRHWAVVSAGHMNFPRK